MVSRNRGQLRAIDRMLRRTWLWYWVNRGDAGLQSTERNSRAEITDLSQGHDRRCLGRQTFSDRPTISRRSRNRSYGRKTQHKIALTLRRVGSLKRIVASLHFAAKPLPRKVATRAERSFCSRAQARTDRNLRRYGRAAGVLCLATDDRCKIRRSGSG